MDRGEDESAPLRDNLGNCNYHRREGGRDEVEDQKRKDEAQVGTMNPTRIDFVSMTIPGTGGDSGTIPRD